ncbi:MULTISPECIES: DUF2787 family protein, partial [unclassified Aeromonas]|uniref:DUF2787 family protein n=1 Tax=unclassified Aeromonas TaxID=257493 RepID=UPI0022E2C81F
ARGNSGSPDDRLIFYLSTGLGEPLRLFDTITDFSYQGYGDWAELDKELDFDFLSPEFTHIYLGVLEHDDAIELYQLWENNFWLYCQMNAFSTALSCT